jgi:hypothetical protein
MAMAESICLTETERELLLELLQREDRQLSIEVRHTDTGSYREQLRIRQDRVARLIDILQPVHQNS